VIVVQVAGADRPSRGLIRVPQRLPTLADGGVPTRAVRLGVGPVGDELAGSGLRFDLSFDTQGSRATTSIH
jgi:hypothetical protein